MQPAEAHDYTNERRGILTFTHVASTGPRGGITWAYRCDCGTVGTVQEVQIPTFRKSCGCSKRKNSIPNKRLRDWTDVRQGKLTVIRRAPMDQYGHTKWECACDCGNTIFVCATSLASGQQACLCGASNATTHGSTVGVWRDRSKPRNLTYRTWLSTKRRCYSVNTRDYLDYGARGIYVCDRWRNDFIAFRDDMGERPSEKHSIDRKNNNGSYTCGRHDLCDDCHVKDAPFNCEWATQLEQEQHKRSSVMLTCNGETLNASQWGNKFRGAKDRDWIYARIRDGVPHAEIIDALVHDERERYGRGSEKRRQSILR